MCSGACPQVKSGTELHTSGKTSKEAEVFFFRFLDWGILPGRQHQNSLMILLAHQTISRITKKVSNLGLTDLSHPANSLSDSLPSHKRHKNIETTTHRFQKSENPEAIKYNILKECAFWVFKACVNHQILLKHLDYWVRWKIL